jgi:hypothetical protein
MILERKTSLDFLASWSHEWKSKALRHSALETKNLASQIPSGELEVEASKVRKIHIPRTGVSQPGIPKSSRLSLSEPTILPSADKIKILDNSSI